MRRPAAASSSTSVASLELQLRQTLEAHQIAGTIGTSADRDPIVKDVDVVFSRVAKGKARGHRGPLQKFMHTVKSFLALPPTNTDTLQNDRVFRTMLRKTSDHITRRAYAALSRVALHDTLPSLDENVTGKQLLTRIRGEDGQEICRFNRRYCITGPILCSLGETYFRRLEQFLCLPDSLADIYIQLMQLLTRVTKLVEDIAKNMAKFCWYAVRHEHLLRSLGSLLPDIIKLIDFYDGRRSSTGSKKGNFNMLEVAIAPTSARLTVIEEDLKDLQQTQSSAAKELSDAKEPNDAEELGGVEEMSDAASSSELEMDPLQDSELDDVGDDGLNIKDVVASMRRYKDGGNGWYTPELDTYLRVNLGLRVVGKREIEGRHSRHFSGGYAEVRKETLKAGQEDMPCEVAIKMLKEDANASIRFLREVRCWSIALRGQCVEPGVTAPSTYIAPLLEVWNEYEPYPVLVMPWASEGNLLEYVQRNKDFSSLERLELALQVVKGVQHLHSQNIIHGDLKAANVLVFGDRARLTDFGISKCLDNVSGMTTSGDAHTQGYQAPELADKRAQIVYGKYPTAASDVYAYGSVMIEILTGTTPFQSFGNDSLGRRDAIARDETPLDHLPSEPKISDEQFELIDNCFEFIPEGRPKVNDLVEKVEKLLQQTR